MNWKGKLRQREEGRGGSCSTAGGNHSSWLSALAEMESQHRAEKPPEIFTGLVGAWAACAHMCVFPRGLQSPCCSLSPLRGCGHVLGDPLQLRDYQSPLLIFWRGRPTASPQWDKGGSWADEYVGVGLTMEHSWGGGGAAGLSGTTTSPLPQSATLLAGGGVLRGCPSPPPPFISPSHGPAALAPSLSGW